MSTYEIEEHMAPGSKGIITTKHLELLATLGMDIKKPMAMRCEIKAGVLKIRVEQ